MTYRDCGESGTADWWGCNTTVLSSVGRVWGCYLSALGRMWGVDCLPYGGGSSDCDSSPSATVRLTGPDEVEGTYCVHNRTFRKAKFCVPSPTIRYGKDDAKTLHLQAEPAEFELGPWQSQTVTVKAKLPKELVLNKEYGVDIEALRRVQVGRVVVKRTDK